VLVKAQLARILQEVPLQELQGPFHRSVAFKHLHRVPGAVPPNPRILSGEWSEAFGGRFTPIGSFRTCYLSLDAATAIREAERAGAPMVHLTIEGRLSAILDLTDPAVVAAMDVTFEDLAAPWALPDASGAEPLTHQLARQLYAAETIEGLLFRSVQAEGGKNLAVFPDRLRHTSWLLIQDPDALLQESIGYPPPGKAAGSLCREADPRSHN
jgi:RES domain-containing protein